jgi:DNA excision repair protein ERCC-2
VSYVYTRWVSPKYDHGVCRIGSGGICYNGLELAGPVARGFIMTDGEMDAEIDNWFAYPEYRRGQREMLNAVYRTIKDKKVLILNAPTGSGKSSVVSAILAATTTRPVIVAVRTVSQLNIFVRELEQIRNKKQPGLKFSYVVGRGKVCRVFEEMGVNEKCKQIKKVSRRMVLKDSEDHQMNLDAEKYVPIFDAAAPIFCPWFLKCKQVDEDSGQIVDSNALCERAHEFCTTCVPSETVKSFAGDFCPYELMRRACQESDVIIVNYQHVLNPAIRKALLSKFYLGENKPVLICDEAHNLGSALEELHSSQIDERMVERAEKELENPELVEEFQKCENDIRGMQGVLSFLKEFIGDQDGKFKKDDIFDYEEFWIQLKRGFGRAPQGVLNFLDPVFHMLEDYQERIDKRVGSKPDEGCKHLAKIVEFLLLFLSSMYNIDEGKEEHDKSLVPIFVKNDRGSKLRVRLIDPSKDALEIMDAHRAMVLMSGTLHPPESYGKYLFGNDVKDKLIFMSLPNVFPADNRKLIVCADASSKFKDVTQNKGDNDNNRRILGYISEFIKVPGNISVWYPSYYMMQDYAAKIANERTGRRILVEPRNAREAARLLEEFMSLPGLGLSGVLFGVAGGKFSEGIDFRGASMVGAMVVGFPLSAFSPEMVWILDYYKGKYGPSGEFLAYTLPCICRSLQALGRVLRDENDRGILVLAERRFLENIRSLPKWMQEEAERTVFDEFPGVVKDWIEAGEKA